MLGKVTMAPFLKKSKDDPDPQATLEKAESLIAKSPTNIPAHQMLGMPQGL